MSEEEIVAEEIEATDDLATSDVPAEDGEVSAEVEPEEIA